MEDIDELAAIALQGLLAGGIHTGDNCLTVADICDIAYDYAGEMQEASRRHRATEPEPD